MFELMDDVLKVVDKIIEFIGGDIWLGLLLGLGKLNCLVNVLY